MFLDYCPTLRDLYSTRLAMGRSGKPFSATSGLSTLNNLLVIRRIMMKSKPKRTLEIGLACGGSAMTFAASHRDLQEAPSRQHIAIDAFQMTAFDDVGRIMLEKAGLAGYVEVREELSSFALPEIAREGAQFGLVYIDGSHEFEDVFCDFYYVRLITQPGGYILFDDSSNREVLKVIRFVRRNFDNEFEYIPVYRYRRGSLVDRAKVLLASALRKTQLTIFRKRADHIFPRRHPLRRF